MERKSSVLKMTMLAILVAVGVVISPILRVEGMCPMAHFINVVCAVFGAMLSGVFYSLSKGKIIGAVIGEVIGTGIIGAIVSYPVMTFIWGRTGLTWFFYVPSFIGGTLIGGTVAFFFLIALKKTGHLVKFQRSLGAKVYDTSNVYTRKTSTY